MEGITELIIQPTVARIGTGSGSSDNTLDRDKNKNKQRKGERPADPGRKTFKKISRDFSDGKIKIGYGLRLRLNPNRP